MPLSPKTLQYTQGIQSPQDQEAAFKQLFEEQAHTKLLSKLPGLSQSIITFKILDANPETGKGTGAFILSVNDKLLYVPVIMSDGQISPLSVFYYPAQKLFLPLENEWVNEVLKDQVPEMGTSEKEDPTTAQDVDITPLVRPPYSGRFVYAAAQNKLKLPEMLNKLAYKEKLPFIQFLKKHKNLFKTAAAIYGVDTLTEALKTDKPINKTASIPELIFITKDHLTSDFIGNVKRANKRMDHLMRDIARNGYAYIDKRAATNYVVEPETTLRLHAIQKSGFYDIYKWDGKRVRVMAIFEPLTNPSDHNPYYKVQPTREPRRWGIAAHGTGVGRSDALDRYEPPRIMVVFPDGKFATLYTEHLLAKKPESLDPETAGFGELTSKPYVPKVGDTGFWVKNDKDGLKATDVLKIKSVIDSDGRKLFLDELGNKYILSHDLYSLRRIDDKTFLVPSTYTFFKTKGVASDFALEKSIATDPTKVKKYLVDSIKTASYHLRVTKGPFGFITNFDSMEHDRPTTIMKIAAICNIPVPEAEYIVKVAANGKFSGYIIPTRLKTALAPGATVPADQSTQAGAMPPGQAGAMPPEQAGAMPPEQNPQSPELEAIVTAINDVQSKLQQAQEKELAAMQERAKALELQNAALEGVASRMQEVLQGIPPDQSPTLQTIDTIGAATSSESTQGSPEAASSGAPNASTASAAQSNPPTDLGAPSPEVMSAAAEVPQPEAFDTAAISQLGRLSSISSVFSNFAPDLTQSLDHLARVLLTLQMNRNELSDQLSEAELNKIENNIETVLKDTGKLLLSLNKKITTLEPAKT